MIRSFRHKGLRHYFGSGRTAGLSVPNAARVGRILRALDDAARPEDMNLPGHFFHQLHGREVRWSVQISGNWRITFGWRDGDAIDVDLEDYH